MNKYRSPYPNELYHYGVEGQKWGVRNAEWYPIDAWKKSLANGRTVKEKVRILKDESAKHRIAKAKDKADRLEIKAKQKRDLANQKERIKNAKIAEKDAAKYDLIRKEAIENGDLQLAKQNIKYFTKEDLDKVIERYATVTSFNKFVAESSSNKPSTNTSENKPSANTSQNQPNETKTDKIVNKINESTQNLNNKAKQIDNNNQKKDVLSKIESVVSTGKRVSNVVGDVSSIAGNLTKAAGTYNELAKLVNANGGNMKTFNTPKEEVKKQVDNQWNVDADGKKTLTKQVVTMGKNKDTYNFNRSSSNSSNNSNGISEEDVKSFISEALEERLDEFLKNRK